MHVFSPDTAFTSAAVADAAIEVIFSPHGGATNAIVHELGNAKKEILVQEYYFTSAPNAKALVDAHNRGAKVIVILDKSQRSKKYSSADFVAHPQALLQDVLLRPRALPGIHYCIAMLN